MSLAHCPGLTALLFRGALRKLAHRSRMLGLLWAVRVLRRGLPSHALALTQQPRVASKALVRSIGRPILYVLSSTTNKEAIARRNAIDQGLVCILTAVEPCLSYEPVPERNSRFPELHSLHRKCLHLYRYRVHPVLAACFPRLSAHPSLQPSPISLAQRTAQHLAGGVARKRLHKIHRLRHLESADPRAGPCDHRFLARRYTRSRNDDRLHRFAPSFVGHADDGHFRH